MIDLSNLEPSTSPTRVDASDNLFQELGQNTYDYKDLLSELIDNAVAARYEGKLLSVSVDIYLDSEGNPAEFVIRDNARGIPPDKLGAAISPGALHSENSLNEHGLGMKQAIAALGKLSYLATKVASEQKAKVIRAFQFGDIPTYSADFAGESGTEICIVELKPIVITNPTSITRSLVPYLGARYRRFLRPEARALNLTITLRDSEVRDQIQDHWTVEEVKPVYLHPASRNNEPAFLRYKLSGEGWKAELTFGYAPMTKPEYDELGLQFPNRFHPYRVSQTTQGLDILSQDRVILFHQLSELGIIPQRHNDYNNIRGEIDLKSGFSTAITKNAMIQDRHYVEVIETVKKILRGEAPGPGGRTKDYVQQKTYPEEIPERLLRDRLADWLSTNPMLKRETVTKEYAVGGIEGNVDILADGEAWELKTDQASAYDVYQLFMYMDVGELKKGFLVAKAFSSGAQVAADFVKTHHDKEIILAEQSQFPIGHPPSDSERAEYY